jgi:hypothetical protein
MHDTNRQQETYNGAHTKAAPDNHVLSPVDGHFEIVRVESFPVNRIVVVRCLRG